LEHKLAPQCRFGTKRVVSSVVTDLKGTMERAGLVGAGELHLAVAKDKFSAHYPFTIYAIGLVSYDQFSGLAKHCEANVSDLFFTLENDEIPGEPTAGLDS
jgi:hypothetical protein